MTETAIRDKLAGALKRVAPEANLAAVDADEDLRQALDIDSFDFLNFLMGIHQTLGVDIPEADYGKVRTLRALIAYLDARTATKVV